MVTGVFLSAFLNIGAPDGVSMPTSDAPRYAAKALYRELKLDVTMAHIEKKYLKIDDYEYLLYLGVVARVATEQRISYTWRF